MQLGGLAVAVLAWIWLVIRAFRQHRSWGLGSLVLPPVGFVFAARHPRKGVAPLVLCLLSLAGCCHAGNLYALRAAGPRSA